MSCLLAACGGAEASNLAEAVVDTLPGGIPRVTSSGPTAWSDSSGITLTEEARWSGEDGTTSEIGQPRSLAVDEAGRVYIVDTKPALIKVFTPDGSLIRTIGGEGEGPGEFRVGFIAVRGGALVLHDPQLARTSVWDTSGAFRKSWHSSCCYWTDILIDRQQHVRSYRTDRPAKLLDLARMIDIAGKQDQPAYLGLTQQLAILGREPGASNVQHQRALHDIEQILKRGLRSTTADKPPRLLARGNRSVREGKDRAGRRCEAGYSRENAARPWVPDQARHADRCSGERYLPGPGD